MLFSFSSGSSSDHILIKQLFLIWWTVLVHTPRISAIADSDLFFIKELTKYVASSSVSFLAANITVS